MKTSTKEGIDRYVKDGVPPGDFLYAVLTNSLKGAFGTADLQNREDLFEIVSYCYNEIPGNCWGSIDIVKDWINEKAKERNEGEDGDEKTGD